MRAIAPRTHIGKLPMLGRIYPIESLGERQSDATCSSLKEPECVCEHARCSEWWLCVGLGARGLVYHAMVAEMLANAVVASDPSLIPAEFRSWQK